MYLIFKRKLILLILQSHSEQLEVAPRHTSHHRLIFFSILLTSSTFLLFFPPLLTTSPYLLLFHHPSLPTTFPCFLPFQQPTLTPLFPFLSSFPPLPLHLHRMLHSCHAVEHDRNPGRSCPLLNRCTLTVSH